VGARKTVGRENFLQLPPLIQFAPLIDNSVHWTMLTYCQLGNFPGV